MSHHVTTSASVPAQNTTVLRDPVPSLFTVGSITLLSGPSGAGKTTLMADWLTRLRDGRSICYQPAFPPPYIGVIATDRPWRDHQAWFDKAGFTRVPHYSLRDDEKLDWDRFLRPTHLPGLFRDALSRLDAQHPSGAMPPGSLVFVDTLMMYLPGNLIDYRQTAVGISKLDQIIQKRKLVLIGTAHTSKQKSAPDQQYTRPQDRILGSMALLGYTDTQVFLLPPLDDEKDDPASVCSTVGIISHHKRPIIMELVRDTQTGLFVPYRHTVEEDARIQELLSVVLPEPNASRTRELVEYAADNLNLNRRTVHRWLNILENRGMVYQPTRGNWSKPAIDRMIAH